MLFLFKIYLQTESGKQDSEDEEDYIIVRDETMSPEAQQPDVQLNLTTSAEEEEPDEEQVYHAINLLVL